MENNNTKKEMFLQLYRIIENLESINRTYELALEKIEELSHSKEQSSALYGTVATNALASGLITRYDFIDKHKESGEIK